MKHPIYSRNAAVHVLRGDEKSTLLDRAIADAGFLDHVESARDASGKSGAEFLVAIKANIMTASVREPDSPVYTDPALVEQLVARLRERGFERIALCESRNVYDYSYTGRDVAAVAEMVGYGGEGYSIEDLSEQQEPFDYGSRLGNHTVGRTWRDADYRISFAKNKTHWQCFFTACLKNVYGCLPRWDKMKHYHGKGIEFYESAVLIADRFPVHFGFLDAWTSGDGFCGHVRDASRNETRTIFASDNIFALDWVAGEKMGVDPVRNSVLQEAMLRWGTIEIERKGDLARWHPWINVRAIAVIALNWFEELYSLSRFSSRALASRMDPRFEPVKKGRWLFRPLHAISLVVERLFEKRLGPTADTGRGTARVFSMRPYGTNVFESFLAGVAKWAGMAILLYSVVAALLLGGGGLLFAMTFVTGFVLTVASAGTRQNRIDLELGLLLLPAVGVGWILSAFWGTGWTGAIAGVLFGLLGLLLTGLRAQAFRARFKPRRLTRRQFWTAVAVFDADRDPDPIQRAVNADHALARREPADLEDLAGALATLDWFVPFLTRARLLPFRFLGTHARAKVLAVVADDEKRYEPVRRALRTLRECG